MLVAARLGLLPHEIEGLDAYELGLVLRGRREREREQTRLIAWQVATMINVNGGRTTVGALLGEEQSPGEVYDDGDAIVEEYNRAIEAEERQAERDAEGWIDALEHVVDADDTGDGDA